MSNEVQVATPQMPDYLKGYAEQSVGQIKVDMKELRIPMLKKVELQGTAFDAAKDNLGHIYDNISMEDFGTSIDVVVTDYKPEWIKWSSERKMLGRSNDGVHWQEGDLAGQTLVSTEGSDAFKCKHYNFYVLLLKDGVPSKLPYKLSFSGMSAKAGDKMYQILAQRAIANGAPMFSFIFTISTTIEAGTKGQYAMSHAELKKEFPSEETCKVAVDFIKSLKDPSVNIVEEEEKAAPAPPTSTDTATPEASAEIW